MAFQSSTMSSTLRDQRGRVMRTTQDATRVDEVLAKDVSMPLHAVVSVEEHGKAILVRFQDLRKKVAELNIQGIGLYNMRKHKAALFHFNEAFRLLTSVGSELLETGASHDQPINVTDASLFMNRPNPPVDFLRPQEICDKGSPSGMAEIEAWILISSIKLMINGALGHLGNGKPECAEQLLLMAIALSEDDDEHSDDETCDQLRRKYHRSMTLMTVNFVLGYVQSITDEPTTKLSETRLRECMESLTQSLAYAEDLLGSNHIVTATVYVSIGRVLLREGYMQGASFAFQSADRIYNTPQIVNRFGEGSVRDGAYVTSPLNDLSDLEVSSILLGVEGWAFGAPAA